MTSEQQSTIYDSHEIFETYIKASSEKDEFIRKFERRFISEQNSPVFLLDLGCNEGTLTLGYLNAIKARLPHSSKMVCVEPNLSALNNFKEKTLPPGLDFEFIHQSAEDYCSMTSNKFDWVIASHSFYWSPSLETLVPKMVSMGKNAVIIIREKDKSFTFAEKFIHPEVNMYSGDTISEILNANKIKFEREVIQNNLQIPPFQSPEYLLFLAFHLDMPLMRISEKLVLETSDYLNDFSGIFPFNIGFYWITSENYPSHFT